MATTVTTLNRLKIELNNKEYYTDDVLTMTVQRQSLRS